MAWVGCGNGSFLVVKRAFFVAAGFGSPLVVWHCILGVTAVTLLSKVIL